MGTNQTARSSIRRRYRFVIVRVETRVSRAIVERESQW